MSDYKVINDNGYERTWEELYEDNVSFQKYTDELEKENEKLNGAIQTYDILLKANTEENKQLKKDIKNIIKILDKNCDDLEATDEEFDSLDRWQGLQIVELEQGSDSNE